MMKIQFYTHRLWDNDFKQLSLWPTIYFTRNTYLALTIISINVFVWDIGLLITKKTNQ